MDTNVVTFQNAQEWRKWLEKNASSAQEVWLVQYKKRSGKVSISYEDSIEEALCFGWIDGKVKGVDQEKYILRFSPRKARSAWSRSNREKAEKLIAEGRMTASGLARIEEAKKNGLWYGIQKSKEAKMRTRTIRQSVTFKASPHDVYEALMDSKKHSRFTGSRASISRKVGGKFSIYGGEIKGENLVLVPDRKIVQLWRYSNWPDGHYSRAAFSLKEFAGGTRLAFTQSGVPEEFYDDIRPGWRDYYWAPMKKMLQK